MIQLRGPRVERRKSVGRVLVGFDWVSVIWSVFSNGFVRWVNVEGTFLLQTVRGSAGFLDDPQTRAY
jgi:hypothetical protein